MKKKDKKKKILMIGIFCVAILMAVGYAALQAELSIGSVGKIYSDWDVEFTDSSCTITSEYTPVNPDLGMECIADSTDFDVDFDHLDKYTGGIDDDLDSNKGADGVGGIELALYTEFATPEDKTEFDIEITNFSSMWEAALISITQDVTAAGDTEEDWILYEFSDDLTAEDGLINKGATKQDVTVLGIKDSATDSVTFTVTATWNPDYENSIPAGAIKKDNETTSKESYVQTDTFLLLWEAYAPGTYAL